MDNACLRYIRNGLAAARLSPCEWCNRGERRARAACERRGDGWRSSLFDERLRRLMSTRTPRWADRAGLLFVPGDEPRQTGNVTEYGVFLCAAARHLATGAALDYGLREMSRFRQRITLELVNLCIT